MPKTVGSTGLRINEVLNGVDSIVDQTNRDFIQRGLYHMVMMPGMQIDAVNEVEGDPAAMVKELKTAAVVSLRMFVVCCCL